MPMTRLRLRLDEIDHKWGPLIQLALGVAIVAVCITLTVLAFEIRDQGRETSRLSQENRTRSIDTARQSRIACQRTRRFAPPLAAWYAQHHVLRPDELAAYRETIPSSCP